MNDLERRALLGDTKAQRECTEKGIVLICPCCKNESELLVGEGAFDGETPRQLYYIRCKSCFLKSGLYTSVIAALDKWNTRPDPPIGRCGECAHWYKQHCAHGPCATEPTDADFFCGSFKPKGGEENG